MDFVYVILGFVICTIMWEYLPPLIFDIERLFPIEVKEDEFEVVNTTIIYIIFLIAAYNSWGYFQDESWGYFVGFWIGVSIFGFIVELIVEQFRWRLMKK